MLFILSAIFVSSAVFLRFPNTASSGVDVSLNAGGPIENNLSQGDVVFSSAPVFQDETAIEDDAGIVFLDDSAVLATQDPLTNLLPTRNGIKKYKVRSGDTLSSVAAEFGISIETIRLANSGLGSFLRVGQELVILPVSGILYETRDGDSLELIASRYNISAESIKKYNPDYQKIFDTSNQTIILPNAKPLSSGEEYINRYVKGLPDLKNYFALPARGWNWGQLHDYNAVDIADQCGSPIYAAAEGLITEESSSGYWNRGYGNYILIEHPNGTKTRYAHNLKNLVRVGDYVSQGDEIALIGNVGNTHGPTGCHLHFEILGARNPFAIK